MKNTVSEAFRGFDINQQGLINYGRLWAVRAWTTKEILTLKRAIRRGLRPDAIAQLLPRHSVRGIIAQTRKERVRKSLPPQKEARRTPVAGLEEKSS
jgi:Ca2+-binding EF-hand superfamily protein